MVEGSFDLFFSKCHHEVVDKFDITFEEGVNGSVAGVKTPDAVKVVRWEAVPLAEGENVIELRAGGRSSVRKLRRVAAKNEYEST